MADEPGIGAAIWRAASRVVSRARYAASSQKLQIGSTGGRDEPAACVGAGRPRSRMADESAADAAGKARQAEECSNSVRAASASRRARWLSLRDGGRFG